MARARARLGPGGFVDVDYGAERVSCRGSSNFQATTRSAAGSPTARPPKSSSAIRRPSCISRFSARRSVQPMRLSDLVGTRHGQCRVPKPLAQLEVEVKAVDGATVDEIRLTGFWTAARGRRGTTARQGRLAHRVERVSGGRRRRRSGRPATPVLLPPRRLALELNLQSGALSSTAQSSPRRAVLRTRFRGRRRVSKGPGKAATQPLSRRSATRRVGGVSGQEDHLPRRNKTLLEPDASNQRSGCSASAGIARSTSVRANLSLMSISRHSGACKHRSRPGQRCRIVSLIGFESASAQPLCERQRRWRSRPINAPVGLPS